MWKETIAIVVTVFALCLVSMNTVSASSLSVTSPKPVSITFDMPKGATFTTSTSFEIENTANVSVTYKVEEIPTDSGIKIIPDPSQGTIDPSVRLDVSLKIELNSNLLDKVDYTGRIKVMENDKPPIMINIPISITYKAELKVSSTSVVFDTISAKESTSESVTFSERLGYKSIEVSLKRTGNEWVSVSDDRFPVSKEDPKTITFRFAPSGVTRDNCVRYHSWTYSVLSTEEAGSYTINLKGEICCPAKLSYDHRSSTTIAFNRPKTEHHTYHVTAKIRVSNAGCERMDLKPPRVTSPSDSVTLSVKNYPSYISGYGSDYIEIAISAPYDAREGTYRGRLDINAGDAGSGSVDITIVIIWPVDFIIAPSSIDFGSIELKERGYEEKSENITLTEFYHYKPVRNLRISKSGEYGNWLREEWDFAEIPPGASRTITLKIEPGLEAVPKDYLWRYAISASEIGAKRMEVKAKIVPLNITKTIEDFKSFRETPLYRNYPSSESIISDGIGILEIIAGSEVSAEDWQKIPVLMKGTLSLLSSLNDGIVSSEEENYGKTVESLSTASVSTSTIESNSNLNNRDISGYATDMSASADQTTEEVLLDAARMLELRGWNIKKAVEHALAVDDISGLKEEENVLESAISYQYAAMLYGLLNNKEKRLESVHEGSLLMDKHDELVSDAADLRIKADNALSNSKENDLIRIGDMHLLLNPYDYDTFFESYKMAERYLEEATKKYKVSGELLLADKTEEDLNNLKGERRFILSLFFIACIVYGVLFISALVRIIGGSMAYMRDMYEREAGDILVT